jgi:hypothetical protein
VRNGDLGTVVAAIPVTGHLFVKLDDGGRRCFSSWFYRQAIHAAALTAQRAAGLECDRVSILCGGQYTRELAALQVSRAKDAATFYVRDGAYEHLLEGMTCSAAKGLAHDAERQARQER